MHVGLVTTAAARDLDEDYIPLARAFEALGHSVASPGWDDAGTAWQRFDLLLLRSAWNYTEDLPAFLAWAEAASAVTRLYNPVAVLRWSTDKRYLLELERAGTPIVPSDITAPGEPWRAPATDEFVVKPAVGAGSRGARRFAASERDAAAAHVARLHAAGFHALTQPYLHSVDEYGETGIVIYDGEYSHAFRKGPLLRRGGEEVPGLFAAERIDARAADEAERAVAARAVAAIPGGAPLYARVDLIRNAGGQPCVLELELTEPSLYFNWAAGSAARFVRHVLARLAA